MKPAMQTNYVNHQKEHESTPMSWAEAMNLWLGLIGKWSIIEKYEGAMNLQNSDRYDKIKMKAVWSATHSHET